MLMLYKKVRTFDRRLSIFYGIPHKHCIHEHMCAFICNQMQRTYKQYTHIRDIPFYII